MAKSPKIAKGKPVAPPTVPPPSSGVVEAPMTALPPKKGDRIARGGTTTSRPGQIVTAANRWRENYNPMRGLTMRRVVELLELGQRGDTAYLQWTYRFIERRYPTLTALITRCEAPLVNFDWTIKVKEEMPPGATPAMAAAQKQTLKDAYESVDNLKAAIKHLARADFRGYSHLQKHYSPDGDVIHLEPLYQWCVCRDGLAGNWFWNPDSRSTSQPLQFIGKDFCIGGDALPLTDFVIREVDRPINEVALVNAVRSSLAEKDWDGFIEIYGIPGGVVTMPANVPTGKEGEYESAAQKVAEGGSGAIPNGATYTANDGPRGVDPFTPRLTHLDTQVIMAGTGGKLTMLAESGTGTLAGKAHADTFQEIAEERATEISECFQRQFDAAVLADQHPGEPALVYFELAAKDETDVSSLVKDVLNLYQADKIADVEWLSEKTGYQLSDAPEPEPEPEDDPEIPAGPQPPKPPKPGQAKLANRNSDPIAPGVGNEFLGNLSTAAAAAISPDLNVINKKLAALLKITDPELLRSRAQDILQWIADNEAHLTDNPELADTLHQGLSAAFLNGVMAKT